MNLSPISIKKYLPLVAGLVILLVIALLAPWEEIDDLLEDIPLSAFALLTGLSLVYFISKAFRFWYILKQLGINLRIRQVVPLYISGQPFSFLPAGELYRAVLLERYHGIKIAQSSPSVTIQGLVEAVVLLSFSIIGAFIIGQNRLIVAGIALLLVLLLVSLRKGWLLKMHGPLNKLPFVSFQETKYRKFIEGHRRLMAPSSLAFLSGLSLIPVLAGVGILYVSAQNIDSHLGPIEAVISYTLPVILSGLSFLPGGIGVGEGGTIGLLHVFGVGTAAAITITLLVRCFTLVIGILYGLIAQIIMYKRYAK